MQSSNALPNRRWSQPTRRRLDTISTHSGIYAYTNERQVKLVRASVCYTYTYQIRFQPPPNLSCYPGAYSPTCTGCPPRPGTGS